MDTLKNQIESYSGDQALFALRKSLEYSTKVTFSTSFGKEDQVITHLIAKNDLPISIFTLDTGRLFEETYATFDRTIKKYKLNIQVSSPQTTEVENLMTKKGPYSFYDSVENRKECCSIRKIEPLKRALKGFDIWITGLRSEQSANRSEMEMVEWDESNQIIKIHPLLNWNSEKLNQFINTNNIPINPLHAKGYPSIGCNSCTRAIIEGEDERAGRWWWENTKKECGLHN